MFLATELVVVNVSSCHGALTAYRCYNSITSFELCADVSLQIGTLFFAIGVNLWDVCCIIV